MAHRPLGLHGLEVESTPHFYLKIAEILFRNRFSQCKSDADSVRLLELPASGVAAIGVKA